MTNTWKEAEADTLRRRRELVAALDRRMPHIERTGEIQIALDTAALKAKALARIADLEPRRQVVSEPQD